MLIITCIRELFTIMIGLAGIGASQTIDEGGTALLLLGIGLVVWGAWDIAKEVRDARSKGEVGTLRKERGSLIRRLDGSEGGER